MNISSIKVLELACKFAMFVIVAGGIIFTAAMIFNYMMCSGYTGCF